MVRNRLRKAWGVKWGLRWRVRQLCFCRIAPDNLNNLGNRVKRSRRQNMSATEAAGVTAGRQALIIILERHSSQDRDGFFYLTLHYSVAFLGRTAFGPAATPHTGKTYDHQEQEEDRSCTIYVAMLDSTHKGKLKSLIISRDEGVRKKSLRHSQPACCSRSLRPRILRTRLG